MKKKTFLILFAGAQLFFIFFYIHTQTELIKRTYERQRLEKTQAQLAEQLQTLKQQLHTAHSPCNIKKFAIDQKMQKINLKQIKQLTS